MIGLIIVIFLLFASGWMLAFIFRYLHRHRLGTGWWFAFFSLAVAGICAGSYFTIHFEYFANTHTRIAGFPIPVGFFKLEDGQWVDYPTPEFFMYPAWLANGLIGSVVTTLPVYLAAIYTNRRKRTKSETTPPA